MQSDTHRELRLSCDLLQVNATSVVPARTQRGHLYALLNPLLQFKLKRSSQALVPHLLLHSNLPPSDSERAAVCNVVAVIEAEMAQLQQRKTMFSQQKRRSLSKCTKLLQLHTAVLSPIRWIPTEILEQIFQYCGWQYIPGRKCHWRELPWAISQVCRTWRKITSNLPCLWNRLPICLGEDTLTNLDAQAAFLTGILARSRNAPLYLYIYAPFKKYGWHPLIDALLPHSKRVEELAIESSIITMDAFQKFKGRLPLLRKITLSKELRQNSWTTILIDIFEDAPLLHEVTLIGLHTHDVMLPWMQLTSFNGNKINRTGLAQVVANSLDLEHLEIAGYSYDAGPKPATLRRLTSLKVNLENPTITSNFFEKLNLPAVEEIEVEQYQGDLLSHLIPMLSRCPRPSVLRKLTLRAATQGEGGLTSLLKLTPQLVKLDLELPPLQDILQLAINSESPPLVPMLETLIVHVSTEDIWMKAIPLTTLAHSRSEIDEMLMVSGERKQLRNIRIVFPSPSSCHMAQVELNGWLDDPEPTSNQSHHFRLWKHILHEELPELDYKDPPRTRKLDLKFAYRLDRLLGAIEDFQLNDVKSLFVRESGLFLLLLIHYSQASELHSSLRRLSCIQPNRIPGDNIYHFRMRSQEILNAWAPSLRKDLVTLQWVLKGARSLIYVPVNDGERPTIRVVYYPVAVLDLTHVTPKSAL